MDDKDTQVTEVRDTKQQTGDTSVHRQAVETSSKLSGPAVAQQVVWYIVGFIDVFLAARVVLQLLGANQGNGFVDFVYGVSGIFAAPFFGMFNYQPTYGVSTLEVGSVVGILVYALVGWGIAKLFTLGSKSNAA